MSFRVYEWVILVFVIVGAIWGWLVSAFGDAGIVADLVAISLTAIAGVLFVVFAVLALKRNEADRAVDQFRAGARFAQDLQYDNQAAMLKALKIAGDIQAAHYRVALQETRNGGASERAAAAMANREHSAAIGLAKSLGSTMFQAYKNSWSPADQYGDPGEAGAGDSVDYSDLYVDAEYYEGGR